MRTYLESADDLVVIADEHHVYYSGSAKKFEAAITELHPLATIGDRARLHLLRRLPTVANRRVEPQTGRIHGLAQPHHRPKHHLGARRVVDALE